MLVYYFVPFIVSNRYLLFWVSNGHNSVTVQTRTHVYMNFFDHKDLGNYLLQLCPKVVKHPVYIYVVRRQKVYGFLTGHITLRRHPYLTSLTNNLTCWRCGTEDERLSHTQCECEALASLRHSYLGSCLDPEDINSLNPRAIGNFSKATGVPWPGVNIMGHKASVLRPTCTETARTRTQLLI